MATTASRTRLSAESRREQLLDLGLQLLATRSLEELSIEVLAEEAGISRGLLYHYFGNKQDFHLAVVRRAADDLYAFTAPQHLPDPVDQMVASLGAYLDYLVSHRQVYVALVRAAAGGNEALREVYEDVRQALVDRIFEVAGQARLVELGIPDAPATRLMAHAWAAMVEDACLTWLRDPHGLDREHLLLTLALALPATVAATR